MSFDTPLWILLGFAASLFNTAIPLIQEKFKADAFAVAYWIKIAVVVLTFPFVIYYGFPTDPGFYLMVALGSLIWCVNDVIYFKAVATVGAGVVSRILPASVIISFLAWFAFEPALIDKYIAEPVQSAAIIAIVLTSVFFAFQLKRCPITWQGIQMVWFVVLAAAIGPLVDKTALGYAPAAQAPFAYAFMQGLCMLIVWSVFAAIRKPVSRAVFLSTPSVKGGLAIGVVATIKLCLKFAALQYCEHPALLSVILFTDALWIIFYYRLTGREDKSNIWAGLGLVGCAAALVLVKS